MSSCVFSKFLNLCTISICQSHVKCQLSKEHRFLALHEAGKLMRTIFLQLHIPRSSRRLLAPTMNYYASAACVGRNVSAARRPRVGRNASAGMRPTMYCFLDAQRTHVASPCGHFALCESCSLTMRHEPCPLCRATLNEYIRVQRLPSNESDIVRQNPTVREDATVPKTIDRETNERKVSPCVFCGYPDSTHILIPCGHTLCSVCAQQHPRNEINGVEEHCPCHNCSRSIRSTIPFYLLKIID